MADNNSGARRAGLAVNKVVGPLASGLARGTSRDLDAINTILTLGMNHQSNRVAVRDFVGGVLGTNAAPVAAALTAPRASADVAGSTNVAGSSVVVPLPTAKPVAVDSSQLTPQERQLAYLDTMFKKPLTMRQAVALSGILPAEAKPPTGRDIRLSDAAQTSKLLLDQSIAEAKLEPDTKKAQGLTRQAIKDHYARQIAMDGGNPLGLAQAGMFQQDPELK